MTKCNGTKFLPHNSISLTFWTIFFTENHRVPIQHFSSNWDLRDEVPEWHIVLTFHLEYPLVLSRFCLSPGLAFFGGFFLHYTYISVRIFCILAMPLKYFLMNNVTVCLKLDNNVSPSNESSIYFLCPRYGGRYNFLWEIIPCVHYSLDGTILRTYIVKLVKAVLKSIK